jgi:hypothetical protein
MPMHDWAKVEDGIYHDFHNVWLMAIRHALNNGVLPPTYYAMGEQVTVSAEADILTLQGPPQNAAPPPRGRGVHAASVTRPAVAVLEKDELSPRKRPRKRIAVRHVSTHRVVAVIELMSPGNKSSRLRFTTFIRKAVAVLEAGVNFFVVDPFPPTARDPNGIHAAIWQRLVRRRKNRKPYILPSDRALIAASYGVSSGEVTAAVEPFAVGQPVPAMPLFLTAAEEYVTVPLEATSAAAWPDVPKVWRDVLEG